MQRTLVVVTVSLCGDQAKLVRSDRACVISVILLGFWVLPEHTGAVGIVYKK